MAKILPKSIKEMLQTVELSDYKECKEYAAKQARVLKTEKGSAASPALDLDLNENEEQKKTISEEHPTQDDQYSTDDWLCWMGKSGGKGGKGQGAKGGKGTFAGKCHHCGAQGHNVRECRKKDAEMAGKGSSWDLAKSSGKGKSGQPSQGWGSPFPSK